jgi:hypothetical protein
MKSRLTLIFAALVVLLGAMVWVVQSQKGATTVAQMAIEPGVANRAQPVVVQAAISATAPSAVIAFMAAAKTAPMVHVEPSGEVKYVARDGDTVSQLAIALLGSDSKEHRDAVIVANSSLRSNPDLVMEGQTYSIVQPQVPTADEKLANQQPGGAMAALVATPVPVENAASAQPALEEKIPAALGAKLKYTAQPGDSVAVLAGNLLGGDTKANRETIIAGNSSLQQNPDHLVAGKSYTIMAPNGLSADPGAPQAKTPTTQPDADEVARLSMGRMLRYTAQPGDSVSKLAVVLLGSDTPANRDLITKSNPSLKNDPDHLVAGQTYWIAAPVADAMP